MKISFALFLLMTLLTACNQKKDGAANPIDQGRLASASEVLCVPGQKLQISNENFLLGKDVLPDSTLFVVQKGSDACASLHNIDHGGLTSWLNVTYSTDCVPNGSFWKRDSLTVQDGNNVYFNLKPLAPDDNQWIRIFTNYGYSTQRLSSEMGLIIYTCAPQ